MFEDEPKIKFFPAEVLTLRCGVSAEASKPYVVRPAEKRRLFIYHHIKIKNGINNKYIESIEKTSASPLLALRVLKERIHSVTISIRKHELLRAACNHSGQEQEKSAAG